VSNARAVIFLLLTSAIAGACGGPGLPPAGPAPGTVDVGYGGSRAKDETTGAVTTVSDKQSVAPGPLSIEELLRGRVPGLQVLKGAGGRLIFRIRGPNSLMNDQEPLFVIDGVQVPAGQVQSALASLLPQDVRQIDVLKDVASTSVYGMRGAGGVIIINTRR
jgi:TonB-dependent SusC/RagA subfamily outer membrane receptor